MTRSIYHFYLTTFLWICTFLCSLFLINDLQLEFFGAAVIILFTWAVIMLAPGVKEGWVLPRSWVLRFAGLFWLLAFLSIFWSELPQISIMGFCFFSIMPLTFFVFTLCPDEKQMRWIGYALALIFAGLSTWAMIQFYFFNEYFDGRARHPLANPNSLAALFNLALFPALAWMLAAPNKIQSNTALILSILLIGGLMSTGSRGAFFAAIPAALFFLFHARGFLKAHWKRLSLAGLSCLILFGSTMVGDREYERLAVRVTETISGKQELSNNRFNIWEGAVSIIKEDWILGHGIGTFFLYYPEHRSPNDFTGATLAHSDPLQYWAEMGVFSVLLFYAFLIAVFIRNQSAMKKLEPNSPKRMIILGTFCGMGAVILHTHVTFNLYNLSILAGMGFSLAVWFYLTRQVLADHTKKLVFPGTLPLYGRLILLVIPFIILGYFYTSYILSEIFVNKARDQIFAGQLERFAQSINLSHKLSHYTNYRSYLLAVNVPLAVLQESGASLSEEQRKELFDQAVYYLEHGQSLNPRSSSALYYLGEIQTLVPEKLIPETMKSPEEYYKQALKLDPLHLGARMALADIYKDQGNPGQALNLLKEGFKYQYNSPIAFDFYGKTMLFALMQGDQELHQWAMRKMAGFKKRMDKSYKKQSKTMVQSLFGTDQLIQR